MVEADDTAIRRSSDPTGTLPLRRRLKHLSTMRLRQMRAQLRVAVVQHDLLGLSSEGLMYLHAPETRLAAINGWLTATAGQLIEGDWMRGSVERAAAMGVLTGAREMNISAGVVDVERFVTLARHELNGIAAAVVQQVSRAAATMVARRGHRQRALTALLRVFDKISVPRLGALSDSIVVGAYNAGKLESYRAAGVDQLGIIPELRVVAPVQDATRHFKVGTRTANDFRVCPECEDFAEKGPYYLDTIIDNDIFPLHPRCRCTWFPWKDKRFRRDAAGVGYGEWQETKHPRATHGRFTFSPGSEEAGAAAPGRQGGGAGADPRQPGAFSRESNRGLPPGRHVASVWNSGGTSFEELTHQGAARFHSAIAAAKAHNPYGAAVTLYPLADYQHMRLFVSPDDTYGFALKGDDIVSVFKHPRSETRDVAGKVLALATAQGGRRLDCFDTQLPYLYSRSGFRAVARLPFNDEYAPEGWDRSRFKDYSGGRPDVVFMVHDPAHAGMYTKGDGAPIDDYDKGATAQEHALRTLH